MKKILVGLLLMSMIFATTACSASSGKSASSALAADSANETVSQSSDVALGSEGISITLPKDFEVGKLNLSDNPDITTTFSNSAGTIAILVIKELKSEVDENNEYSAYDYLVAQHSNLPDSVMDNQVLMSPEGEPIFSEVDGINYFEYTYLNLSEESFKYFNTAYESDDAFWLVQFACAVDDYDSNKSDFIKWAKTVSFY